MVLFPALMDVHQTQGRAPASYVPNDDVIAVPVSAEISFYEKHILDDKKWSEKSRVQQQVRIWQENELMAQRYGLDTNSGAYFVPQQEEKWRWFQKSYFRFLTKKGEKPLQQEGQELIDSWVNTDEVDSIDEMEASFRATTRRSHTGRALPRALQERQVAKTKKFRFHFQPRVEQGLLILRAESEWFDARAWLGVNGESEFKLEREFKATGTRFMMNYYGHTTEYLANVDQRIHGGWSLRFTNSRDPDSSDPRRLDERKIQLRYGAQF